MAVMIDNTAAVIEWRVTRGDDWSLPLVKKNSPVSMSGWTWLAQVKPSASRTETAAVALTADTTNASSGAVLFTVANTLTDAITAGTYWYEIQRTNGGVIRTMLCGPLIIEGDTADS